MTKEPVKKQIKSGKRLLPIMVIAAAIAVTGSFIFVNYSKDKAVLKRLPKIPELADKKEVLKQKLTDADKEVHESFDAKGAGKSFGSKAGQLGKIYHANNFYDHAMQCYEIAKEFDPENPRWPYYLAFIYQTTGENQSIIPLLEKTLELAPDYSPCVLKLADIHFKTADLEKAKAGYHKCLELSPGDQYALLALARIAIEALQWETAQEYLEQAIKTDPYFVPAHRQLATVHEHFGRIEEKQKSLDKAKGRFMPAMDPWIDEIQFLCYDADQLLVLGDKARHKNDMDTAHKLYQRALDLDPYNLNTYLSIGKMLVAMDRRKDAEEFFDRVITLDPQHAVAYSELGMVFLREYDTKTKEAEQMLLKALEFGHENANVYYNLGEIRFRQADFKKAIEYYKRAFDINPRLPEKEGNLRGADVIQHPNSPRPYMKMGNKLLEQGLHEKSKIFFEKALELDSNHIKGYLQLSIALLWERNTEKAEQILTKALELKPENAYIYFNIGQCRLQQKDYEGAIDFYKKTLAIEPNFVSANYKLGLCFEELGQPDKTVAHFKQEIRLSPDHSYIFNKLAHVLAKQQNYIEAAEYWEKALESKPKNTSILYNIASSYTQLKKHSHAVEYYRKVLGLKPKHFNARFYLAWSLFELGQTKQSLEQYHELLKRKPNNIEVLNGLAWVLAVTKDTKFKNPSDAIKYAEKASKLTDHNNPAMLDTLATAYASANRFDKAIETAKKALKLANLAGQKDLANEIKKRIKLYQAGKTHH